jgi:preprotein translocase subunit SecF
MKTTYWPFAIIKRSFLWLLLSATLLVGSWILFVMNFRPSIEFTGWVQMGLEWLQQSDTLEKDISEALVSQWFSTPQIHITTSDTQASLVVSLPFKDDTEVKKVSDSITQTLLTKKHIVSEENIVGLSLNGPSVSNYMKSSTINALIVGIIFIAIYMMFSFASMRKHISPLTLAIVTIVTMIFDVSIPAWVYGIWMMINPTVTVDTIFIIALMTTIWYSINDTIIVLDRIRENTIKNKDGLEKGSILYANVFESSLRQTMRRSLGTSFSTLLAIAAMYFFGESVMKSFAFTMGAGVIAWSFSSIFLSSTLTYLLLGVWKKEFKKI